MPHREPTNPTRTHVRQRALRWGIATVLLMLVAIAASRVLA